MYARAGLSVRSNPVRKVKTAMLNMIPKLLPLLDTAEAAAATEQNPTVALLIQLAPFAILIVVFYFLLIRPQRKKDKQVKNMLAALKVGDRICTIGGLYGTIAALKDDTVTLTMGSLQNTIVIARWAIRSVENVALENDAEPQI